MMRTFLAVAILVAASAPLRAQTATGIGTGISNSSAVGTGIAASRSQSTAISGQGGGGGNATSGPSTVNITSSVPPVQTINTNSTVSGSTSVKTNAAVFAPGLSASAIETCLGSVSGGAGWVGGGFTLAGTIKDDECEARLDARTLISIGARLAAAVRLCQMPRIYASMPGQCDTWRQMSGLAVASAAPAAYRGPGPLWGAASYTGETPSAELVPAITPRGSSILLIEGKTGQERLCNDYDERHTVCRKWAYTHAAAPKPKPQKLVATRAPATTLKPTPARLPAIITDPPPPSPSTTTADKAN